MVAEFNLLNVACSRASSADWQSGRRLRERRLQKRQSQWLRDHRISLRTSEMKLAVKMEHYWTLANGCRHAPGHYLIFTCTQWFQCYVNEWINYVWISPTFLFSDNHSFGVHAQFRSFWPQKTSCTRQQKKIDATVALKGSTSYTQFLKASLYVTIST